MNRSNPQINNPRAQPTNWRPERFPVEGVLTSVTWITAMIIVPFFIQMLGLMGAAGIAGLDQQETHPSTGDGLDAGAITHQWFGVGQWISATMGCVMVVIWAIYAAQWWIRIHSAVDPVPESAPLRSAEFFDELDLDLDLF